MTEKMNKLAFCLDFAGQRMDQSLWVENDRTWDGLAFVQRVETWTRALADRHVSVNQVVAVSLPPSVDLFASVLATWRLGASVLLLPQDLSLDESFRWVQSAEVSGGIVHDKLAKALLRHEELLSWNWGIVQGSHSPNDWSLLEGALEQAESQGPPTLPAWDASRRAVLSLSAGAWQPPLGVSLSQGQIWSSIESLAQDWQRVAQSIETALLDLPVSNTLLQVGLGVLLGDAQISLAPNVSLAELAERSQSSSSVCLTTSRRVVEWGEDLSAQHADALSLEWLWVLGGTVPDDLRKAWPTPLYSAYKIEGCGGIVAWSTSDEEGVGRLLPGLEHRVEREPHLQRHLRPGEALRGEILLRGKQVSLERLNTESIFFQMESSFTDWLSTGDWGSLDRKKHLQIEGHVEDMIEYRDGHFSIRPMEQQLRKHPQILDAVLCKVDHDKKLKAFLEVDAQAPGRPLTSRTVLAYLQEHFPHYMHPKLIEFREELPRNLYGQVARWKLK